MAAMIGKQGISRPRRRPRVSVGSTTAEPRRNKEAARAAPAEATAPLVPPAGRCNGTAMRRAMRRVSQIYDEALYPALHLGVDELLLSAAHLPDAIVVSLPVVRHPVQHLAQVAPEVISQRRPRAIALTRRARRSNCSGRTSLRDALCGSRIRRDLLDGGFCQGLASDRSSGESDGSSALSDLSRTTSLSSYTTIPATSCATAPRSSESTLLVVDLSCLVARCSFRSFTTTASMSAARTRAPEPADAASS